MSGFLMPVVEPPKNDSSSAKQGFLAQLRATLQEAQRVIDSYNTIPKSAYDIEMNGMHLNDEMRLKN